MTKFGSLKIKILHNLTEAYIAGDKKDVKKILESIKENNEFKELYLFYEEVENMYIEDKEIAKVYVESVEKLLKEKTKRVSKYCTSFNKQLKDGNLVEVELYEYLDLLTEDDSLKNVDKKMLGKKKLVEHLTTKKNPTESADEYTSNENLLHVVLAGEFNTKFEESLTENEKKELKKILSISNEELTYDFNVLQEEICSKLNSMVTEEVDTDVKGKLKTALLETTRMKTTKYNYYKLQQLRNGL